MTQDTDHFYGPFKSKFAQILKALSNTHIRGGYPASLLPWMVGLLVFGGTNPVSQFVESESAFEFGFSKKKNLDAWRKCGTAPLTSCFLKSCQVMIEIGDYDDATNQAMQHIQSTNDISTHFVIAY